MSDNLSDEIKQLAERYRNAPESRIFAPLADAYRKSGLIDKSIEICEDGLKRFPDYASAHVILGKCFYDKGATERSRGEFKRVLEIDSENMVALKFLGDILLGEDKKVEAAGYYRTLLAIDPTNEEILKSLKDIEKDFEAKEIDLEDESRVKKTEQPRELATMTLAGIYASQGYYAKALSMYEDICSRDDSNREAASMVERLKAMIDHSEEERSEAFGEEVLTISIDDVSRELVENTAGHGGYSGTGEEDDQPGTGDAADREDENEEGDDSGLEEIAAQLEGGEGASHDQEEDSDDVALERESDEKDLDDQGPGEGKDHFHDWIKKMQEKHGKND
ncbi:MAG: tetratricopeptide repeat protein [Candidatus Krumholzibacteriota bacterium]|nr:tetratricopeptide repeat protein [Candidatus Krumholzibacteriota bacterium]